jgi:hypothetical protein
MSALRKAGKTTSSQISPDRHPDMIKKMLMALTAAIVSISSAYAESPRIWGSMGTRMGPGTAEAQLRYIGEPLFWNLQPVLGVSMARGGSGWIGAGSAYTWRPNKDELFVRFTSMVGIYKRGNGANLGGPIQFRNGLDLGFSTASGMEYGIGFEHLSNAGLYRPNPGINTAYLFASFALH